MKVHLGCWSRNIPGWVNVDLCDLPHIHHKTSIDNLEMFDDSSCDLLYSSHSFEYFDVIDAPIVLNEWKRVLKPGGTLRLAVPDFQALSELYAQTGDIKKVLGPLFGRMEIVTENGNKKIFHKTACEFNSLEKLLNSCGFSDVKRYRWQDTIHKEYDDHSQAYFPHMDKKNGKLLSLNVEAIKSG